MKQPGLDHRHRDKDGTIARKHGNTLISTLRQTYGQRFAPGIDGNAKLSDVLHQLDEPSLTHLVGDTRFGLRKKAGWRTVWEGGRQPKVGCEGTELYRVHFRSNATELTMPCIPSSTRGGPRPASSRTPRFSTCVAIAMPRRGRSRARAAH